MKNKKLNSKESRNIKNLIVMIFCMRLSVIKLVDAFIVFVSVHFFVFLIVKACPIKGIDFQ